MRCFPHDLATRWLKGVRSVCCGISAAPKVCTMGGKKNKKKRQRERQRSREPGRRGRRRDWEAEHQADRLCQPIRGALGSCSRGAWLAGARSQPRALRGPARRARAPAKSPL